MPTSYHRLAMLCISWCLLLFGDKTARLKTLPPIRHCLNDALLVSDIPPSAGVIVRTQSSNGIIAFRFREPPGCGREIWKNEPVARKVC